MLGSPDTWAMTCPQINFCLLSHPSCNQCGRESKLVSKFYELELNIQGHKQLTDCITEFLKVWARWCWSPAIFSKEFQFLPPIHSLRGRCRSEATALARWDASEWKWFFLQTQKMRIEAWSKKQFHDITCSCYGFKKHLEVAFLVKILCQES